MTKFKKGDLVRYARPASIDPGARFDGNFLEPGKVYRWVGSSRDGVGDFAEIEVATGHPEAGSFRPDAVRGRVHTAAQADRFDKVEAPSFKVGDRVRCISTKDFAGWCSKFLGREFVVSEAPNGVNRHGAKWIELEGQEGSWSADHFELVVGTPALKKGDKVRVLNAMGYEEFFSIGDVLTVLEGPDDDTIEALVTVGPTDGPSRSSTAYAYRFKKVEEKAEAAPAPMPAATWIVVLSDDATLKPATRPYQHGSRLAAQREAERLSRENPGKTFLMFQAVASVVADVPKPVVKNLAA